MPLLSKQTPMLVRRLLSPCFRLAVSLKLLQWRWINSGEGLRQTLSWYANNLHSACRPLHVTTPIPGPSHLLALSSLLYIRFCMQMPCQARMAHLGLPASPPCTCRQLHGSPGLTSISLARRGSFCSTSNRKVRLNMVSFIKLLGFVGVLLLHGITCPLSSKP